MKKNAVDNALQPKE